MIQENNIFVITPALLAPKFLLITLVSVIAPIIADQIKFIRFPTIIFEIILGIIIGPQVLDWIQITPQIEVIAGVGLSFLMFLAGYEVDIKHIAGKPLNLGFASWIISFGVALVMVFLLKQVKATPGESIWLISIALTTTTFGVLLPILQDANVLKSHFGHYISGAATIGEFGPLVLITMIFTHSKPYVTALFLTIFVLIAVMAAFFAVRAHQPRILQFLSRHLNTSNQLPVRISMLLIFCLISLTLTLGLNVLLGAFSAGIVFRLLTKEGKDEKEIESKLKAIGYGLLIPFFFIASGISFDLHALASTRALLHIPIFLGCLLIVRIIPVFILYRGTLDYNQKNALTLFSATGLPFIVVITKIGNEFGLISSGDAASLITAAILSVLLFPFFGLLCLKKLSDAKHGCF